MSDIIADTPEKKERMVRSIVGEVFAKGRLELLDEYLSSDYIDKSLPPFLPPDREGFKALVSAVRAGFPDVVPEISEIIVAGDKVVHRGHAKGTHTGPFMGLPPTGRVGSWKEIHVWTFRDGKIVHRDALADLADLFGQLGVLPPPPTPGAR